MKPSFAFIASLLICTATITVAAPSYSPKDIEARSPTLEYKIRDEFGGELIERGAVGVPGVGDVVDVAKLVIDVVGGIKQGIAQDKTKRSQFTADLVSQLSTKDPTFNYIVCHTKHTTAFDGVQGTDWGHYHQELDVDVGGTIGYEIYWVKSGKFTRIGDGGYLNWAYVGNVKSTSKDGKEIVFGPR